MVDYIDEYQLVEQVGYGGFGTVYKALHPRLPNRFVAIKLFRGNMATPQDRDTFAMQVNNLQEALVLNELYHPHILRIIDCGLHDDHGQITPYLITEFAPGGSLRDRLNALDEGETLPFEDTLRIVSQIGEALQYAHDRNILHCDLKPENILFDQNDQAVLADFGIAVVLSSVQSRHEIFLGTFQYMSPEQFGRNVGKESDQYSLACIAYELFVGRHPFDAKEVGQWVNQHLNEIPPAPEKRNPALPSSVGKVILKGLEKDYTDRYPSMSEFIGALKYAFEYPYTTTRYTVERSSRTIRRESTRPRVYTIARELREKRPYRKFSWNDDSEDDDEEIRQPLRRIHERYGTLAPFSPGSSRSARSNPLKSWERPVHVVVHSLTNRREDQRRRRSTQKQLVRPIQVSYPSQKQGASVQPLYVWWPSLCFLALVGMYGFLSIVDSGLASFAFILGSLAFFVYIWFCVMRAMYDASGCWAYIASSFCILAIALGSVSFITQSIAGIGITVCICAIISTIFRFLKKYSA